MTRQIVGFELRLPEAWHAVPTGLPDASEWARTIATDLVRGAATDGKIEAQIEDTIDVLAEQLVGVTESVEGTGIAALETAVLVRSPELGIVDAMIVVNAQQGLTEVEFTQQLGELVEESDNPQYVYAGQVEGTVEAGGVAGLHTVLGNAADDDMGEGIALLEERVVLGVFPAEGADMVEVTAVARSVGIFDDMPQEMIDLLGGLSIETEKV